MHYSNEVRAGVRYIFAGFAHPAPGEWPVPQAVKQLSNCADAATAAVRQPAPSPDDNFLPMRSQDGVQRQKAPQQLGLVPAVQMPQLTLTEHRMKQLTADAPLRHRQESAATLKIDEAHEHAVQLDLPTVLELTHNIQNDPAFEGCARYWGRHFLRSHRWVKRYAIPPCMHNCCFICAITP